MSETEPLPDHLRCKRTDGRQWRCNRRVMDDKKLCEIHHLQGRHRQYRKKVPESLKIQRKNKKLSDDVVSVSKVEIRAQKDEKLSNLAKKPMKRKKLMGESQASDEAVKKMRLKKGDLQLELIRMVLKREVEKRTKMTAKKKKKKRKKVVVEEIKSDNESGSNSEAELMRDLPNGLMAISPAKHFNNVGSSGGVSCPSPLRDVKIGGAGDSCSVSGRCFRSKNIEPMPIGTLQVVPYKEDLVRLRRGKGKRCHWCRRSGLKNLIKCSSCLKEFYCLDCIKEQYSNVLEEVKIACPVCRGTCGCKACSAIQCADIECKGSSKDKNKVEKVLHFHYLICMLLPVLKQINQDQSTELEIEAKVKGQKSSEVQIHRADASFNKQPCCNSCKTSIVDFHRSCPKCSYNLCLSCSQDIFHGSLSGSVKALLCKCSDRRKCTNGKQFLEMKPLCTLKWKYGVKYLESPMLSPRGKVLDGNGGIPCPPTEFGGCGDGLLELSCLFPLRWIKELEVSAEEIVGCYELPETLDVYSRCSLCHEIDHEAGEIEQLQRAAMREDSFDNLLYYPTVLEIHKDNLEHFQKHWGKGQPVIIRNVLQGQSDLSWDPIVMFCTYIKNNAAKTDDELATDCLDWFEVEIGMKHLFMGTLKGQTQRNMWQERLKVKGWLSSHVFREHFPIHYAELLHALPLPEYMDPVSGVLNVAAELSQEIFKPELGPSVYISYGCGESLLQGDSVLKLRYDSYDQVNILVHATDVPVSTEQLNYIRKLMKKHKEQNKLGENTVLDEENIEKVGLHDMVGEEMQLHKKVARVSWFSAATHEDHNLRCKERGVFLDGEGDTDSDSDTDTDTEVSKFFFGPVKSSRTSENLKYGMKHADISTHFVKEKLAESCGAQWDIFRRQDVPMLVEYLQRHSNEFTDTYGFRKRMNHPILDQNFFIDTRHKMRLKEEFNVEPWTFMQHVGEAVIIPAGCPYQVRNLKSCVNVVLDFVSPENVAECIQVIDELRQLPHNHKAKADSLEVKKMALHSICRAIKEFRELTCAETTSTEHRDNCKD